MSQVDEFGNVVGVLRTGDTFGESALEHDGVTKGTRSVVERCL